MHISGAKRALPCTQHAPTVPTDADRLCLALADADRHCQMLAEASNAQQARIKRVASRQDRTVGHARTQQPASRRPLRAGTQRATNMHSAGTRHALAMHIACTQHAPTVQTACSQHACRTARGSEGGNGDKTSAAVTTTLILTQTARRDRSETYNTSHNSATGKIWPGGEIVTHGKQESHTHRGFFIKTDNDPNDTVPRIRQISTGPKQRGVIHLPTARVTSHPYVKNTNW